MSVRKNTAYNLLGAALPIGLSLMTIPIYIGSIGEARYGVLAIAWLLLGYFGLFDLGLGAATAQRIAALAGGSPKQRAETFWTALVMNSGLGAVGGLAIWPVAAYFFGKFFSVDEALRPELGAAIPWLILAVPLTTLSGVLTGAMQGRAQFLELNIISVINSMLIQLIPLLTVWLDGPDLSLLLPSVILARLMTLSILFWRCRVHVFQGQLYNISPAQAKSLLQFGGWVTVSSLVGPMMVILDRFIIAATVGAKAITYYTVPFQLAERSAILPSALSNALFPRLAVSNEAEANQLAGMAIRSLAVVMTPMTLVGVLLIEPFLRWWLNPEFASQASFPGQILLLGFWINSFARIPFTQLQAKGRPDIIAKCHVAELTPYLALLYFGLHLFGLPGAALVFGLRTFADCAILLWFAGSLRIASILLFTPLLLLFSGFGVAIAFRTGTPAWWTLVIGLLIVSLTWSWRSAPEVVRSLFIRITEKFKKQNKR